MTTPSTSESVAALKSVQAFSAMDDATLRELAANFAMRSFKAQARIFDQFQPAEASYVVASGQVKVYKLSPRGDEQILHVFGPGQMFGEAAMWAGDKYPAAAEAVTDCRMLSIGRSSLLRAIRRDGELALHMMAGMSAKLRQFAQLIEDLSLKDVPARLARVLLEQREHAASDTFRLRQTKRQLAGQIGTVAETLSRALAKLRSAGVIEVKGTQIRILDAKGLKRLAEHE